MGDWEDVCRGPVGWDVATLQAAGRVFGDSDAARVAAVAVYGEHDEALVEDLLPLRILFVTTWGAVGALDHPERRERLDRRLAWLRERLPDD
jgi:hypothetical protein